MKMRARWVTKKRICWWSKFVIAAALVAACTAPFAPFSEVRSKSKSALSVGLFYSACALLGNAGTGALRKLLSQQQVGHAENVGFAMLLQGSAQIIYLAVIGALFTAGNTEAGTSFWTAAVGSSVINAFIKTMETKAFAENDISLCAPFLAFDPVMQFLVAVIVLPATCASPIHFGCDEVKTTFPTHHILAVFGIAVGAFWLAASAASSTASTGVTLKHLMPVLDPASSRRKAAGAVKSASAGAGGIGAHLLALFAVLPLGSRLILVNCILYGFTSRKIAVS